MDVAVGRDPRAAEGRLRPAVLPRAPVLPAVVEVRPAPRAALVVPRAAEVGVRPAAIVVLVGRGPAGPVRPAAVGRAPGGGARFTGTAPVPVPVVAPAAVGLVGLGGGGRAAGGRAGEAAPMSLKKSSLETGVVILKLMLFGAFFYPVKFKIVWCMFVVSRT